MAQSNLILLLYAPRQSERLSYTVPILFDVLVGIPCKVTNNLDVFIQYQGPRIAYADTSPVPGILSFPDSGLLWETGIRPIALEAVTVEDLPALFPIATTRHTWPFDLPAMAFFLLSRYEEYLPFQSDAHGRFPAAFSAAHRFGFLELPILHQWADRVRMQLRNNYSNINFTPPKFSSQLTYDIDQAWAFKHKGWIRQTGGALNELLHGKTGLFKARLQTLAGMQRDPFDTFSYLERCAGQSEQAPLFFFLLGDSSPFDPNLSHRNPALRSLIKRLAGKYQHGIHPSYNSTENEKLLKMEIARLADITGGPVLHSRQHYLRLKFPQTYRSLLYHGIAHDYTLGFADAVGFRAGIATPFPWYDLSSEQITSLTLHPFQVMDVTLKDYLGFRPEEAMAKIGALQSALRATGGAFSALWHNSSFSDAHGWSGWSAVHEMAIGSQSSR